MKTTLVACCLVVLQPLVRAVEITIGSTQLTIPAPAGYAPVTAEMKPYSDLAIKFVAPSNEQFAIFLPASDAQLAASGGIPQSERRFCVQTAKEIVQPFVSNEQFAELKQIIKTQNDAILKKAAAEMPDLLAKASKELSDDYSVALKLAVGQMLPLPPHYDTTRGLAYSTLVKYDVGIDDGSSVYEGVVTATFVHIRGKVLFLYSYAEKSALDWSREESARWADSVITANPSSAAVAVRESHRRATGIDWAKAGGNAIGGAIIGSIIGILGYVFRKKKG
jgi:hypothetical protein